MRAPKVAYIYSGPEIRSALRRVCDEMGFSLVVSLSPADDEFPGFPGMAGILLIAATASDDRIQKLCAVADNLCVPVLFLWDLPESDDEVPPSFDSSTLSPVTEQALRLAVKEALDHPERFVGVATLRC